MPGAFAEPSGGQPVVQVDAFTREPFRGNPAAVCVLKAPRGDAWLQAVAREMNLSETAFLLRRSDGFSLRWFTPSTEVPLCGHATLASAHVLWEAGELPPGEPARFHTRSGELIARGEGEWIALDFPAQPLARQRLPGDTLAALGVDAVHQAVGSLLHLVEVDSEEAVRHTAPDFPRLARACPVGVTVTSRAASSDYDFVSRFFAPGHGIDEDPVTGSAHCALGPYWAARLGKSELVGYQASARGGIVRVRTAGPGIAPGRVELLGQAVTVLRGVLV